MLQLDQQVKNDKAFKNIKGNMFAGICMAMRRDIKWFSQILQGNHETNL